MERKKIDEDLAIIFDGIEDPAKIEALGRIKGNLDAAEKDEEQALNKATEYANKWKESILKGGFNEPKENNPVPDEHPKKTFMDYLKDAKEGH